VREDADGPAAQGIIPVRFVPLTGKKCRRRRDETVSRQRNEVPLALVDGSYRTAPAERSLLARTLPSLHYYAHFAQIIWRSSRAASRGVYGHEEWSRSSLEVLRALEAVGVRIEVRGTELFRNLDGPCVFVGNHMSALEAFVLPSIIQPLKTVTFIVKRSLVEYPVFGHIMRSRDPVLVGRTNPREDLKAVLEGGAERLRRGTSIIVFPRRRGRRPSTRRPSTASASSWRSGRRFLSCRLRSRPTPGATAGSSRTSGRSTRHGRFTSPSAAAARSGHGSGRAAAGRRVHPGTSPAMGRDGGAGGRPPRELMPASPGFQP